MRKIHLLLLVMLTSCLSCLAQEYASIVLTQNSVSQIRNDLGNTLLFDLELERVKEEIDQEIELGFDVLISIPMDLTVGKYDKYLKGMSLAYTRMYPTLLIYPTIQFTNNKGQLWKLAISNQDAYKNSKIII